MFLYCVSYTLSFVVTEIIITVIILHCYSDTNRDTASEESVTITEPMPEKSHDEKIKEMTTQVVRICVVNAITYATVPWPY